MKKTDEEIREAIAAMHAYIKLSQEVGRPMDETHTTVRCVADGLLWLFGEQSAECPIDSTVAIMRVVAKAMAEGRLVK